MSRGCHNLGVGCKFELALVKIVPYVPYSKELELAIVSGLQSCKVCCDTLIRLIQEMVADPVAVGRQRLREVGALFLLKNYQDVRWILRMEG